MGYLVRSQIFCHSIGHDDLSVDALNCAKANAETESDKRVAEMAIEFRQKGRSLRPLLGSYDYLQINRGMLFKLRKL